jgi:predicted N-acetyltransferase YhbS
VLQVATIHDVVVHPALGGQGVGRFLVRSLVRAINMRGITDIGCCVPVSATAFFQVRGAQLAAHLHVLCACLSSDRLHWHTAGTLGALRRIAAAFLAGCTGERLWGCHSQQATP